MRMGFAGPAAAHETLNVLLTVRSAHDWGFTPCSSNVHPASLQQLAPCPLQHFARRVTPFLCTQHSIGM